MMLENYTIYWGKSNRNSGDYHLLQYHCLDVAAAGFSYLRHDYRLKSIFNKSVLLRENPGILSLLLAVHDIGKFSQPFQDKIQKGVHNEAGHTAEGFALLQQELYSGCLRDFLSKHINGERNLRTVQRYFSFLMGAVTGHHGIPVDETIKPDVVLLQFGSKNRDDAVQFLTDLIEYFIKDFQYPVSQIEDKDIRKSERETIQSLTWLLSGLSVVSDWIGSNENYFAWKTSPVSLDEYWNHALSEAESALLKTGLLPPQVSAADTTIELFGFSPRPLQEIIERLDVSAGPNLFIIEESTGGGKTEASLILAKKLMKIGAGNGFYFALPTMATANAIFERIAGSNRLYQKYYTEGAPISVVLAHGQQILNENYRDFIADFGKTNEDTWMYDTNKKALLSSIGVGTVDQVLMGVLPWRHQSLRLLGCARNILIIDEVHAYDTYMNTLLEELLRFLKTCGSSVILLSATLPRNLKSKYLSIFAQDVYSVPESTPYPLLTQVGADGVVKEIAVPPSPEKYVNVSIISQREEVINTLIETAEKGGCACWICNAVADAVAAYQDLKKRTNCSIHLFHARFTMGDRLKRENEVMALFGKHSTQEERSGHILVATQVVEQSLDLDFDYMVSDLAPIDLIIQRAGRLWRHTRTRPEVISSPVLAIHSPDPSGTVTEDWYSSMFPRGAYVYPEHGKLWMTARLLGDMHGFSMPKDARYLIDSVYTQDETRIPEILRTVDAKVKTKKKVSEAHANRNTLNLSQGYKRDMVWSSGEPATTREGENTALVEFYKDEAGSQHLWIESDGQISRLLLPSLSRMSIRARAIRDDILAESQGNGADLPLKVVFKQQGDVWIPLTPVFKSSSCYYSEEVGLVLDT